MFYYPISRKGLITKAEVINKTPYNLEQHVNTKSDVHCEVCTKQFNNSYVTIRNQLCVYVIQQTQDKTPNPSQYTDTGPTCHAIN